MWHIFLRNNISNYCIMPVHKKPLKSATLKKSAAKKKKSVGNHLPENPDQFEEERSTSLRMKPQPFNKKGSTKKS